MNICTLHTSLNLQVFPIHQEKKEARRRNNTNFALRTKFLLPLSYSFIILTAKLIPYFMKESLVTSTIAVELKCEP